MVYRVYCNIFPKSGQVWVLFPFQWTQGSCQWSPQTASWRRTINSTPPWAHWNALCWSSTAPRTGSMQRFFLWLGEGFHGLWRWKQHSPQIPQLEMAEVWGYNCSWVVAVAYGRSSNGTACDQHISLSVYMYIYISYYIILRLRRANSSAFWKLLPPPTPFALYFLQSGFTDVCVRVWNWGR